MNAVTEFAISSKLSTTLRQPSSGAICRASSSKTSVFGSERLTGALLDRLTHHVHILEMNGDSFRLASSRKRQKDKEGSKMT